MASIKLTFDEKTPHTSIKLVPVGKVPFSFGLNIKLTDKGDNTVAQVEVDANINPMMAMIAKRPLENLVNVMAGNINAAI